MTAQIFCSLIALIVVFAVIGTQAHHNSDDSELFEYDKYEYKYFGHKVKWKEAQERCAVWGGHLITIHSDADNDYFKDRFDDFWLGLSKWASQKWSWVDNSPLNFEKWKDSKPNSSDRCGDCKSGKWNGALCDEKRGFVCKRPKNSCPCDFESPLVGAPNPIVITEFEDDKVEITVEMAQRTNGKMQYALGFGDEVISQYRFIEDPEKCHFKDNAIDTDVWSEDKDRCHSTFTLKMSLQEFIQYAQPEISNNKGEHFVQVKTTLHMIYLDDSELQKRKHCAQSMFSTPIVIQVLLIPDSQIEFEFEGDTNVCAPPSFSSVTVNDEGKLVIDALIFPSENEFVFSDFKFHRHSKGYQFLASSEECNCLDALLHHGCQYRIKLVSIDCLEDFSGELVVEFMITRGNVQKKTTFSINLQYKIVNQPPVLTTAITTKSTLVSEDCMSKLSVFSPFDRAYILTETESPIAVPNIRLGLSEAFLCCTKDHQTLPPYDPDNGKYGCTQFDPSIMNIFEQLIASGQPQGGDFSPQIEDLGNFVTDKVAFSFDPSSLYGQDRLCYVHVRTVFEEDNRRRSLPASTEGQDHIGKASDSSAVITFKSCSTFGSEEKCMAEDAVCEWNGAMCANKQGARIEDRKNQEAQESSASISRVSACAMVAFTFVACMLI